MNTELIIWLAALIGLGILEAATVSVVSLWFMGGALAAIVVNLLGAGMGLQVAVFLVVSVALLACLRPFVKKFLRPRLVRTNADRILGEKGVVTEAIDNLAATGAVKIEGVEWSARSQDGSPIPCGQVVRILRMEGVKIWVEPADQPEKGV